jgi:segregation and condensation protein B
VTSPDDLVRAVEAALFAAEEPMTAEELSAHLGRPTCARRWRAGGALPRARRAAGRARQALAVPDRARLAHLLRREKEQVRRLSRAATEVLAIVAYHEPVSRAEIEAIRGVQTSAGTLDVLMEAGWVRVAGRREVPGRR